MILHLVRKIKNMAHVHKFNKPIISMYISFNSRDIVYECKCGYRQIFRINIPYEKSFPIETSNILTIKELESYLNR